jgi:hypothetical protein
VHQISMNSVGSDPATLLNHTIWRYPADALACWVTYTTRIIGIHVLCTRYDSVLPTHDVVFLPVKNSFWHSHEIATASSSTKEFVSLPGPRSHRWSPSKIRFWNPKFSRTRAFWHRIRRRSSATRSFTYVTKVSLVLHHFFIAPGDHWSPERPLQRICARIVQHAYTIVGHRRHKFRYWNMFRDDCCSHNHIFSHHLTAFVSEETPFFPKYLVRFMKCTIFTVYTRSWLIVVAAASLSVYICV